MGSGIVKRNNLSFFLLLVLVPVPVLVLAPVLVLCAVLLHLRSALC